MRLRALTLVSLLRYQNYIISIVKKHELLTRTIISVILKLVCSDIKYNFHEKHELLTCNIISVILKCI